MGKKSREIKPDGTTPEDLSKVWIGNRVPTCSVLRRLPFVFVDDPTDLFHNFWILKIRRLTFLQSYQINRLTDLGF